MRSLVVPLVLCCAVLSACRSSHPTPREITLGVFTPDGSAIVYSRVEDGNCYLYRHDLATGKEQRVTSAKQGCEIDPAYSPDGSSLAFMRAPEAGKRAALIVAKSDGTSERVVVDNTEDNLAPVFVPHSHAIVFLRSAAFEHYSPLVDNRRHKFDVFEVDLDNNRVTQLTHEKYYEISHLSVSTDGKQLLMSVSVYPQGDLFRVLPLDSAKATPHDLQPTVPHSPTPPPIDVDGTWSPDGKSVFFEAATQPPNGGNFDYNLYRLDLASGKIEQLTQLTGMMEGFSLSADGAKAVILRQGHLYLLDLNSRQLGEPQP